MRQLQTRTVASLLALTGVLVLVGCGGSQPAGSGQPAAPAASDLVTPLTGPEAQGDMSVKAADGSAPCGVFNVNGFGDRRAIMADYPACSATKYTVQCLDDKAQWQSTYITGVKLSADRKELLFTSAQEGACAIFPAQ